MFYKNWAGSQGSIRNLCVSGAFRFWRSYLLKDKLNNTLKNSLDSYCKSFF